LKTQIRVKALSEILFFPGSKYLPSHKNITEIKLPTTGRKISSPPLVGILDTNREVARLLGSNSLGRFCKAFPIILCNI
jgi:hypothetical protein